MAAPRLFTHRRKLTALTGQAERTGTPPVPRASLHGHSIFYRALFRRFNPGQHLCADRPRVHAGLRHYRAHQFCPWRSVHAGLIHGPADSWRAWRLWLPCWGHSYCGGTSGHSLVFRLRLYAGKGRLQAPAGRAAPVAAYLRHWYVHLLAKLRAACADVRLCAFSQPAAGNGFS